MKKLIAVLLLMVSVFSVGATTLADDIPKSIINPQQQGHIAFLESQFGEKQAKKIVEGYGRPSTAIPEYLIPNYVTEDVGIIISQPDSQMPELSRLKVGDYFTMNGRRYIVGRFATAGAAQVLVAFPVDKDGNADVESARYFYL